MPATVARQGQTLVVTGDDAADVVFVTEAGGQVQVTINGQAQSPIAHSALQMITFDGQVGIDVFTNTSSAFAFAQGGTGSAIRVTGSGGSVLVGGIGYDVLMSDSGNDVVFGGAGRDTLVDGTWQVRRLDDDPNHDAFDDRGNDLFDQPENESGDARGRDD